MKRTPSSFLRTILALALISPGFSAVDAAAQVVGYSAAGAGVGGVSAAAAAGARLSPGVLPAFAAPLTGNFTLTPSLMPSFSPAASVPAFSGALSAIPAASLPVRLTPAKLTAPALQAATLAAPSRAAEIHAAAPARASAPHGMVGTLTETMRPDAKNPAAVEGRVEAMFDGGNRSRALSDDAVPFAPAVPAFNAASVLEKSAPRASGTSRAVPPASAAPAARSRGVSIAAKVLLAAAILLILTPGVALAAPVAAAAPVVAAATSLSFLASIHPAASAAGAVIGAAYGLFASRPKDGSSASAADVFSSVLHYGAIGGFGVYALMDVTQLAFAGGPVGIASISGAIVTAALGRTAFGGKFADRATTSADRIVGAFPAVAAALGISVGITALATIPLSVTLATTAMAITGVAAALYAALFKLGRSPLDGPATMAKGYVMQALMLGLALTVSSNPYLFWPFALMGASGFGLTAWAMFKELRSFLPGYAVPAPPVVTPPAPAPKPNPGPIAATPAPTVEPKA